MRDRVSKRWSSVRITTMFGRGCAACCCAGAFTVCDPATAQTDTTVAMVTSLRLMVRWYGMARRRCCNYGPVGGNDGFTTRAELLRRAARGAAGLAVAGALPPGEAAAAVAGGALGTTVHRFYSRPELRPPIVKVVQPARGAAEGLLFLAPDSGPGQSGPLIMDDSGQVVWFEPTTPLT